MVTRYTWEQRVDRAEQLAQGEEHSRTIIQFYAEILKWQQETSRHIAANSSDRPLTGSFEIDHPIFLDRLGSLLDLARRSGSEALAALAGELAEHRDSWKEFLASYWNGDLAPEASFFARVGVQPYLELLVSAQTPPFDSKLADLLSPQSGNPQRTQPFRLCPFCGRKPQLAFLSDETAIPGIVEGSAEGGHRYLMCGDCLTVWPFQRIACSNCTEENRFMLPYYSARDVLNIRVECCDSCKVYIKSIDLTKDRRAVPPVDELAAIPLDLWARGQGYRKVQPNLAGM